MWKDYLPFVRSTLLACAVILGVALTLKWTSEVFPSGPHRMLWQHRVLCLGAAVILAQAFAGAAYMILDEIREAYRELKNEGLQRSED